LKRGCGGKTFLCRKEKNQSEVFVGGMMGFEKMSGEDLDVFQDDVLGIGIQDLNGEWF
jgi:hypothetical protein